MIDLDLDRMTEIDVYNTFVPNGKEEAALTGSYAELVELIGCEATLKLYRHFKGCKLDLPKFLYKQEYIVELAVQIADKRERAKIAVASGYTANRLEVLVCQRRKDDKN